MLTYASAYICDKETHFAVTQDYLERHQTCNIALSLPQAVVNRDKSCVSSMFQTCARDDRPSAITAGTFGVVFLVSTIVVLSAGDIITIVRCLSRYLRRVAKKSRKPSGNRWPYMRDYSELLVLMMETYFTCTPWSTSSFVSKDFNLLLNFFMQGIPFLLSFS